MSTPRPGSVSGSSLPLLFLASRLRRSQATDEPAQDEENGARNKDGHQRRVIPGVVDILASIEKRPYMERACVEIPNNLSSLISDRRELLRWEGLESSASSA
jgi:hypothetical protein